jgi:hypothetical protein
MLTLPKSTPDIALPSMVAHWKRQVFSKVKRFASLADPVLPISDEYPGLWLESAPYDGLQFLRLLDGDPAVAEANVECFFKHQRPDGQLPCYILDAEHPHTPHYLELGAKLVNYSQIQELVPLAWVALEMFKITKNEEFLLRAYSACSRWDAWLVANRMTRGEGVFEIFCEFDMGYDFSPRAHDGGIPKACPGSEARNCPDAGCLPLLAPDLSAVVYGSRKALAEMAGLLGRPNDQTTWLTKAEELRSAIYAKCWDEEDDFFYDVDAWGDFRRYRTIHITHLLSEGVVTDAHFDRIYERYIKSPDHFWTQFPLPSVSISDPSFSPDGHQIPNNWGYWSNGPCMYRLSRWMTKNGRQEDLKWIMSRWLEAAEQRWPEDVTQAIDPFSGEWSPASPNHSNTLFFLIEAAQTTRESHSLSSKTGNGHASLSRSDKLMASPSLG